MEPGGGRCRSLMTIRRWVSDHVWTINELSETTVGSIPFGKIHTNQADV
jgi:hypothetical protein